MKITTFDIGLFVRDINVSLNFYKNILGLSYIETVEIPVEITSSIQFSNRKCRLHRFSLKGFELKLIETENPPEPKIFPVNEIAGFRYITLHIEDFDKTYNDLLSKGVTFLSKPFKIQSGVKIVFFKDPDGNYLELMGD